LPQFVGCFTQIYNGTKWIGLKITEDMVGHKFGEFASTRKKRLAHGTDKLRSKAKMKLKQKAR
jgi:small subunit ribosomal protein S19